MQQATLPPLVRGTWYPMSWEEFLGWSPREGPSEWVDGEGIARVSNGARHGRLVKLLGTLLDVCVRVFDLGEVFSDNLILRLPTRPSGRMPDVFVIARDRLDQVHHQWADGPAPFAAEFISDESVERDLIEKRAEFERAGIPEYLAVEARLAREGFTYLRRDAEGHDQPVVPDERGHYHSEALPGFWFRPEWFWQDPAPDVNRLMLRIAPEAYRRYLAQLLAEATEE